MADCSACGEENSEQAAFCQACAAPLQSAHVGEACKTVTVVFADVVGFTALGERPDTESITRLM